MLNFSMRKKIMKCNEWNYVFLIDFHSLLFIILLHKTFMIYC